MESPAEKYARVLAMSQDQSGERWSLSEDDRAALLHVLGMVAMLAADLGLKTGQSMSSVRDDCSLKTARIQERLAAMGEPEFGTARIVGSRTWRLYCDQCEDWITPVEGVTATYQRGEWWCAKHASCTWADGKPTVDEASKGKLTVIGNQ